MLTLYILKGIEQTTSAYSKVNWGWRFRTHKKGIEPTMPCTTIMKVLERSWTIKKLRIHFLDYLAFLFIFPFHLSSYEPFSCYLLDLLSEPVITCVFYFSNSLYLPMDKELVRARQDLRWEIHTNSNSLTYYCFIIYSLCILLRWPKYFSIH